MDVKVFHCLGYYSFVSVVRLVLLLSLSLLIYQGSPSPQDLNNLLCFHTWQLILTKVIVFADLLQKNVGRKIGSGRYTSGLFSFCQLF